MLMVDMLPACLPACLCSFSLRLFQFIHLHDQAVSLHISCLFVLFGLLCWVTLFSPLKAMATSSDEVFIELLSGLISFQLQNIHFTGALDMREKLL